MYLFEVPRATAEFDGKSITVKLYYPNERKMLDKSPPEDLEWGVKKFSELLEKGYAEIATPEHPIRNPSAGGVYVFDDDTWFIHRRDAGAPLHPLYHSIPCGYPETERETTVDGLRALMQRELPEENLIFTKDGELLPLHGQYAIETAERIGISPERIKTVPGYADALKGMDKLEIYNEDGSLMIGTGITDIEFSWEGSTTINALWFVCIPYSAKDILPVDAEGMYKDGTFIHFNREAYLLTANERTLIKMLDTVNIPLKNEDVHRTKIEDGIPRVYVPSYEPPFFGPDGKSTDHPNIFAPDNLLRKMLYGENWVEKELEYEARLLEEKQSAV